MFVALLLLVAKVLKQLKCPVSRWMRKEEVCLPWNTTQPEKSEILPFAATRMDLEGHYASKIRQRKTDTV